MSSSRLPDTHPVIHGLRVDAAQLELLGCSTTRQATSNVTVSIDVVPIESDGTVSAVADGPGSDRASPPGAPLARLALGDNVSYVFFRRDPLVHFKFPGLCHGHLEPTLRHLHVETNEAHFETARLLVPNTLLSVILGLDGELVLHASAAQMQGRTVAVCGPSGSGKSSLAALALQRGAAIVSDDALRIYPTQDDAFWCYPGSPELRLRPTREWPKLDPSQLRNLPDGRTGYLSPSIVHSQSALHALVFPVPTAAEEPTMRRVTGLHALGRVLSASRIAWAPEIGAAMLVQLRHVADRVAVYDLSVPWQRFSDRRVQQDLADYLFQAGSH